MIKSIIENWFVIVAAVAGGAVVGYKAHNFFKMPSDKQLKKVSEWLIYAVTVAEKKLGAGTGRLKLRYVYDMFVTRFNWLAEVITFEKFSLMVDDALGEMKDMLQNNEAVQNLVAGEQKEGE